MDDGNLSIAIVLVVAGYLLLSMELFLPTGGILGVLSIAAIGVGISFGFKSSMMAGTLILIATVAGIPLFVNSMTWLWPKTRMGRKMTVQSEAGEDTIGAMASNMALKELVGAFGITLTELRPSGMIDFEGKKVDGISEGILIPEGQRVRCVGTQSGYVVVRLADTPDLNDLEDVQIPGMDLGKLNP